MERAEMPAVLTTGIFEFTHKYGRLWHELQHDAVIRLVSLRPGRHRAWITPDPPPGSEPVPIGVNEFVKSLGQHLDDIRGGAVYEIQDSVRHTVLGYAFWSAPDCLAVLECVIPYETRNPRTGRPVQREMYPLAVEAEPSPLARKAVLANA